MEVPAAQSSTASLSSSVCHNIMKLNQDFTQCAEFWPKIFTSKKNGEEGKKKIVFKSWAKKMLVMVKREARQEVSRK